MVQGLLSWFGRIAVSSRAAGLWCNIVAHEIDREFHQKIPITIGVGDRSAQFTLIHGEGVAPLWVPENEDTIDIRLGKQGNELSALPGMQRSLGSKELLRGATLESPFNR